MRRLNKELEKEREILCRLIIQESNRDGNRTLPDAIIAQSQKVDTIISAIEQDKTMEKLRNKQKIVKYGLVHDNRRS